MPKQCTVTGGTSATAGLGQLSGQADFQVHLSFLSGHAVPSAQPKEQERLSPEGHILRHLVWFAHQQMCRRPNLKWFVSNPGGVGCRGEEQASLWAGLDDENTPRAILKGHTATVWSVDASDHLAVSGGMDTSILFWDLGGPC